MTHDQDLNMAIAEYQELIDTGLVGIADAEYQARAWMAQEDRGEYVIGCPDRTGRRAMILAMEVARAIACVDYDQARRLMRRLNENLEDAENSRRPGWD